MSVFSLKQTHIPDTDCSGRRWRLFFLPISEKNIWIPYPGSQKTQSALQQACGRKRTERLWDREFSQKSVLILHLCHWVTISASPATQMFSFWFSFSSSFHIKLKTVKYYMNKKQRPMAPVRLQPQRMSSSQRVSPHDASHVRRWKKTNNPHNHPAPICLKFLGWQDMKNHTKFFVCWPLFLFVFRASKAAWHYEGQYITYTAKKRIDIFIVHSHGNSSLASTQSTWCTETEIKQEDMTKTVDTHRHTYT